MSVTTPIPWWQSADTVTTARPWWQSADEITTTPWWQKFDRTTTRPWWKNADIVTDIPSWKSGGSNYVDNNTSYSSGSSSTVIFIPIGIIVLLLKLCCIGCCCYKKRSGSNGEVLRTAPVEGTSRPVILPSGHVTWVPLPSTPSLQPPMSISTVEQATWDRNCQSHSDVPAISVVDQVVGGFNRRIPRYDTATQEESQWPISDDEATNKLPDDALPPACISEPPPSYSEVIASSASYPPHSEEHSTTYVLDTRV